MLIFVIILFIMIARYFGEDGGNGDETGAVGSYHVEKLSAGNMKRTFVSHGKPRDWYEDYNRQWGLRLGADCCAPFEFNEPAACSDGGAGARQRPCRTRRSTGA